MSSDAKYSADVGDLLVLISQSDPVQVQDVILNLRGNLRDAPTEEDTGKAAKRLLVCLRCCAASRSSIADVGWVSDMYNFAYCYLRRAFLRLPDDDPWKSHLLLDPPTESFKGLMSRENDLVQDLAHAFKPLACSVDSSVSLWTASDQVVCEPSPFSAAPVVLRVLPSFGFNAISAVSCCGLWGRIGLDASLNDPDQRTLATNLFQDVHKLFPPREPPQP